MKNETLLIPEKIDSERESVATVWQQNGGTILRIGKFWEKPTIDENTRITIYGNDTFSLVLAQILEIELLSPKDELIGDLDIKWIKRKIEIITKNEVKNLHFPYFIKPVQPKLFQSAVYASLVEFDKVSNDIENEELIIASEPLKIECEVRSFILRQKIMDLAIYEGDGNLDEARIFIQSFLAETKVNLPSTYVLDIGYNSNQEWFVIEFNSSWGAGLNSCRPENVVHCIREASINQQ